MQLRYEPIQYKSNDSTAAGQCLGAWQVLVRASKLLKGFSKGQTPSASSLSSCAKNAEYDDNDDDEVAASVALDDAFATLYFV